MKRIQLLLFLFLTACFSLQAQETGITPNANKGKPLMNALEHLSVTATVGTGTYQGEFKDLKSLSLGSFAVDYKVNSRFSFGLTTIAGMDCGQKFITNDEGVVTFIENEDDDDDDDEFEDESDEDNDFEDLFEDIFEDDCGTFGDNIIGTVTYHLSEKVPFFVQAGAGYTFRSNVPTTTIMLGYNQKLFAGLGITAGVRYNQLIASKNTFKNTSGLKAELGLSWGF